MKKRTFQKIKRFFLIIVALFIISGFFYIVFWTNFIRIFSFEYVGIENKYQNTITENLNNDLNQKYFYFITNNNLITYRSDIFKKTIANILINAKEIKICPSGLHSLKISVINHTPIFILENKKVISSEGIEYLELNDTSKLPLLITSTKINPQLILPIDSFVKKINTVLFDVDKIIIDEYADVHLINTKSGSEIKFKSSDDIEKLWSTFISAIDTSPLKKSLNDKNQKLLYIDLRFGNKVFYKFQPTTVQLKTDTNNDIIATTTINYATTTSERVLAEPNR